MLPGGRSSSQLPQSLAEVIQCRAMNPISLNLKCNRNFQPKLYFTNSTLAIEPLNCYNRPICSKRREYAKSCRAIRSPASVWSSRNT